MSSTSSSFFLHWQNVRITGDETAIAEPIGFHYKSAPLQWRDGSKEERSPFRRPKFSLKLSFLQFLENLARYRISVSHCRKSVICHCIGVTWEISPARGSRKSVEGGGNKYGNHRATWNCVFRRSKSENFLWCLPFILWYFSFSIGFDRPLSGILLLNYFYRRWTRWKNEIKQTLPTCFGDACGFSVSIWIPLIGFSGLQLLT